MTEITIQADEQLFATLQQIALQKAKTFEEVVQQALLDWVSDYRNDETRSYSFIGIGRSGRNDLSISVEEILADQADRREGWSL